jgi:serpin B
MACVSALNQVKINKPKKIMVSRKTPLLLLFLLLNGLASCNKAGVVPDKGMDLVLTSVERQKVAADNAFTLKLFKNIDSANTVGANLFISPLSVSFALGMTSNGAAGQTLTAIDKTMNFTGFSQGQINSYYDKLITDLPKLESNTTINIANSILYRQNFSVLPQFAQTNTNYYHAKVQALDFNSPAAVSTINNWVSEQTNGKIPTIINSVPADVVMYLINAIYFKSDWNTKFDAAKTAPLPFYLADNSSVQTQFMDGKIDYKRYDNTEAHVFELPYVNKKYSMVIVMPETGTTLRQLVTGLDSVKWKTWMAGLYGANTEIKLPKFTFSYNVGLNGALKALGMGVAFGGNADFSGINATVPLQITEVKHKAFIAVDESGTTAAAVTSVAIGLTATLNPPPTVIDHPFIFAIREMSSGLVLFVGTMNNPNSPSAP